MEQIEKQRMIEFLTTLNDRRYIDLLATLTLPVNSDFYRDGDEFIICLKHQSFTDYYFNLSKGDSIKFFNVVFNNMEKTEICPTLYSFDENIYKNPVFVKLFGTPEIHIERIYGVSNKIKQDIILPGTDEIREITVDDKDMIEKFTDENKVEYGNNFDFKNEKPFYGYHLLDFYNSLVQGSKSHWIYGYFRNGELTAFLDVCMGREKFAHIGFIFTSRQYRQHGMASNLAKHYANEFMDKDVFISYGNAANENSVKTALAAGFELFAEMYCCWIQVS